MQSTAASRSSRWAVLLAAPIAWAIFFDRALFSRQQFGYRDASRFFYPLKYFIQQELRRGELPLWSPWAGGGQPLLANLVGGVYHPFTLLYFIVPFDWAFKLNIVLAYLLALGGLYLFARRLGCRPSAALAGAFGYAFSGYLVSLSCNLPYLLGAAQAPLFLWALDRVLERFSWSRLTLAGFCLAIILLGGDAEAALIVGLLGIVYSVWQGARQRGTRGYRALRNLGLASLACLAAIGVSAAQLGPSWHFYRQSNRRNAVAPESDLQWATFPLRYVTLAMPDPFVDPDRSGTVFSQFAPDGETGPWADSLYLGMAVLLLAAAGVIHGGDRGRFFLYVSGIFSLLTTGRVLNIEQFLRRIPPFGGFHWPEKYFAWCALGLCLLAALGSEAVLASDRARKGLAILSSAAATGSGLFWLAGTRWRPAMIRFFTWLSARHSPLAARILAHRVPVAMGHAAAVSAATAGLLWLLPRLRPSLRGASLAMAVCLDLLATTQPIYLLVPRAVLHDPGPAVRMMARLPLAQRPRFGHLRVAHWIQQVGNSDGMSDPQKLIALGRWLEEPDFGLFDRVESARFYDAMILLRSNLILAHPGYFRVAAGLLSARWLLHVKGDWPPDGVATAGSAVAVGHGIEAVPLRHAPRAFLVARTYAAPSATRALRWLYDPHFHLLESATVEGPYALPISRALQQLGVAGQAEIRSYAPRRLVIRAHATRPALLVLTDAYWDEWRATLDGEPAPIIPADVMLRGLVVPPGDHRIAMDLPGTAEHRALAASLAVILLLSLASLSDRWRRHP